MNPVSPDVLIQALAATHSPVTITDALQPDNPIVYCNEAFVALTGYSEEEIIGKNCRFLQGEGTDRRSVAALRDSIASHNDSTVTLLNYTKNGEPFWNDLQVTPVRNADGVVTHFFGFQNNISERLEKDRAAALVEKLEAEIHLSDLGEKLLVPAEALAATTKRAATQESASAEDLRVIEKKADALLQAVRSLSDSQ